MKEWVEHYNNRAKLSDDAIFVAEMNWESAEATKNQMQEDARHLLNLLCPKNDSNLLDLGCCSGNSIGMVKEYFSSITGVDMADEALKIAKKNYPDVTFICDDITQINSIEDNSFSHILSFGVLHYLSNTEIQSLLNTMYRVLKPGGKVVIGRVADAQYYDEYQKYRSKKEKQKKDTFNKKAWNWINKHLISDLAKDLGFKVKKQSQNAETLPLKAFFDVVLYKEMI